MDNYEVNINSSTSLVEAVIVTPVPLPVVVAVQNMYNFGGGSEVIQFTAGEQINSHTPLALVGNLLYKLDSTNVAHQFSFVGFSKTSGVAGSVIEVEDNLIVLSGWGLTPGVQYLAGPVGSIVKENVTAGSFTKVLGVAQDADTLLIIKNYLSIIKS